ncbi:MAG: hypothetical protein WBW33_27310 [Bryobacteraceae bacterium]
MGSGVCPSGYWKRSNKQSASAYRQRDEQAIPPIGVARCTGDPWGMKQYHPQKEHEAKQDSRDAQILTEGESE